MTNRYIKILILVVSIIIVNSNNSQAQDPQFTQFYANPLYLNPAFAGTGRCPRVSLNYRNQWPGIPKTDGGTYNTSSASYDQHIDAISGGIGLLIVNDKAGQGTLTSTNISGIYSYQLPVTRNFSLKAGVQATYMQKKLDWTNITFGDMIDARRGFIYNTQEAVPSNNLSNVNNMDFSAGILGYSKHFFFGIAANHLTEPNESLLGGGNKSPLPRKITGHAGAVLDIGGDHSQTSISPNILYQKQGDFEQINLGLYLNKGPVIAGLWYRLKDSFILLLGLQNEVFKIGYSYDITSSKLPNFGTYNTHGSHELSLGIQFYCKPKKRKFRTVACPSF